MKIGHRNFKERTFIVYLFRTKKLGQTVIYLTIDNYINPNWDGKIIQKMYGGNKEQVR